jgi:hypothetical protein
MTEEPDRSAGTAGVLKAAAVLASLFDSRNLSRLDFFFRPIAAKCRKERQNQNIIVSESCKQNESTKRQH